LRRAGQYRHFTHHSEDDLLTLIFFAALIAFGFYVRSKVREEAPRPQLSEDKIKQKWRELGFFCELDDEKKTWTLTGSRRGLLYFPDLLLGYVADPQNATDGEHQHYGPYGSLEIMTWHDAGIDGHAIRGSLAALTHLAELVEAKLATAQPGEPISIREEFAPESRYSLVLDVRDDDFDPSTKDREGLGVTAKLPAPKNVDT
jgi:hypothetical protein